MLADRYIRTDLCSQEDFEKNFTFILIFLKPIIKIKEDAAMKYVGTWIFHSMGVMNDDFERVCLRKKSMKLCLPV